MSKPKFLFLGIDGLDYDLVHKYKCEFLLWLMENNQHGVLISDDRSGCNRRGEPLTGPAWNTIYSGLPASLHRLTADVFLRGGIVDVELNVPTIWDILGKRFTLGLLALAAYKPLGSIPPVNGWAINGFARKGKVEARDMYPQMEIPDWFKLEEYSADRKDSHEGYFDLQKEQVENKLRLLKQLPKNEIMAIGVQIIDWHSHEQLDRKAGYEFIDDWMMRTISQIGPTNFLICSDHGFQEHELRHSQTGVYVASLGGGEIPRRIYDMAPLTLFLVGR